MMEKIIVWFLPKELDGLGSKDEKVRAVAERALKARQQSLQIRLDLMRRQREGKVE